MDAAAWAGPVGDVWAAEWRRTDRSFAGLSPALDAAILARAPERGRAADVGCGAGQTAIALGCARPELSVLGIDLSPALVAVAGERAAGSANVAFRAGAVEMVLADAGPFDLVVSRHGVMFFDDPVRGMVSLRAAAAAGAWLVFSCFDAIARNGWAGEVVAAVRGADPPRYAAYAPGPFGFADPAFVDGVLRAAGWRPEPRVPVPFAYRAGEGDDAVGDALDYFTRIGPAASLLRAMASAEAGEAMLRLRAAVERRLADGAVDFPAAAWIWSARVA